MLLCYAEFVFVLCRFRSLAVNEYKSLGVRIVWTAVKFPNEIELENGDIAGMHSIITQIKVQFGFLDFSF